MSPLFRLVVVLVMLGTTFLICGAQTVTTDVLVAAADTGGGGWYTFKVYAGPPIKDTLYCAHIVDAPKRLPILRMVSEDFGGWLFLTDGSASDIPYSVFTKPGGAPFTDWREILAEKSWGRIKKFDILE